MKLYFSPGACSLAAHIALHEVDADFEHERVDLKSKRSASGSDFTAVNPKGYVPALVLDEGEAITENVAILDWIADKYSLGGFDGPLARTRLLETLAFISTEIHKSFKPLFAGGSDDEKAKAREAVLKRLQFFEERLSSDYLAGDRFSVADCYLLVMLLWSDKQGIEMPEKLAVYRERLLTRPSVQTALQHET